MRSLRLRPTWYAGIPLAMTVALLQILPNRWRDKEVYGINDPSQRPISILKNEMQPGATNNKCPDVFVFLPSAPEIPTHF